MLAEHDLCKDLFITKEVMEKSCSETGSENVESELVFCLWFLLHIFFGGGWFPD